MDIGSRIRAARKAAGFSQEELARRADLSLNGIAILERGGRTDPHYSTLAGIAGALDMSVAELVGEEATVPLGEEVAEWEEARDLHKPIDLKGKTRGELFELKERLKNERRRLYQGYTREQLKTPTVSERLKQDARFIALLNELNVRDALDEIAGEQHATPSPKEEVD
jgi:transcriptional regulator with XRE-family HTH domain